MTVEWEKEIAGKIRERNILSLAQFNGSQTVYQNWSVTLLTCLVRTENVNE